MAEAPDPADVAQLLEAFARAEAGVPEDPPILIDDDGEFVADIVENAYPQISIGGGESPSRALEVIEADEQLIEWVAAGYSFKAIGAFLGCNGATAKRHWQAVLARARERQSEMATQVQLLEYHRLEKITKQMMPALVDEQNPNAIPRKDDVNAYVNISRRKAALFGADAYVAPPSNEGATEAANTKAQNTEDLISLLDRVADSRMGSGVIIDAEEVDEEAEEALRAGYKVSSSPPTVGLHDVPEPSDEELNAIEADDTQSIGYWKDGVFVTYPGPDDAHD